MNPGPCRTAWFSPPRGDSGRTMDPRPSTEKTSHTEDLTDSQDSDSCLPISPCFPPLGLQVLHVLPDVHDPQQVLKHTGGRQEANRRSTGGQQEANRRSTGGQQEVNRKPENTVESFTCTPVSVCDGGSVFHSLMVLSDEQALCEVDPEAVWAVQSGDVLQVRGTERSDGTVSTSTEDKVLADGQTARRRRDIPVLLTLRSTHASSCRLLLNRHSRPELVMQ
ncbi:hypothetical protein F7725_021304 [Dissostichus mawsoni]|uniref:Uncharacterized protein n=1 Tax=Dissostichus mawsoni TaxID=36200 RepID=A0A7J5YFM5_DISMA|nr:hypothetical protein F7725_021304 [Dissostichus mawsoni]